MPAILEFQSPSTAVANAPIPRSARGIVWVVSSLVVALIALAGVIPVDQVVTTQRRGGLTVVRRSSCSRSKPRSSARSRFAKANMCAQASCLARLDPTFASADVSALASQVSTLEAESRPVAGRG